jgi:hypothetical protein
LSSRRRALIEGFKGGNLLETIYSSLRMESSSERDDLAVDLAALHNEGLIDLVAVFAHLKKTGGPDFFLTRYVFQEALQHLNSAVRPVMDCVLHLYKEAGEDMAAGWIMDGFIGFCEKDTSRPRDALIDIEANPNALADLLVASLIAGSRVDNHQYVTEAIRLCEDKNIELRRRAVYSVGKLSWPQDVFVPDFAFAGLERSAETESDDQILAGIIKSMFALYQRNKNHEDRVVALMLNAFAKGGELTLHAASELYSFYGSELPTSLSGVLIPNLKKVKATSGASLRNIDHGISRQFEKGDPEEAVQLLEDLLLADSGGIALKTLSSTAHLICTNAKLFSKVVTRWFLRGDSVFCDGIQTISGSHPNRNSPVEVDSDELEPVDSKRVIFVAHKAIGYLFFQPVSASIVISLMHHAPDDETLKELGSLLSAPLLLNFTGSVHAYVARQSAIESGKVKETIERALNEIDDYLQTLRSVGTLPALQPSAAQREAHHRHFSRTMTESFKAAVAQSPLVSMISKSVLLYGRKSIDYIYDGDGQSHRMEMDLKSHGTEIEYPRMTFIDPCGLDYMLRIFRFERLKA